MSAVVLRSGGCRSVCRPMWHCYALGLTWDCGIAVGPIEFAADIINLDSVRSPYNVCCSVGGLSGVTGGPRTQTVRGNSLNPNMKVNLLSYPSLRAPSEMTTG